VVTSDLSLLTKSTTTEAEDLKYDLTQTASKVRGEHVLM
jgi:hypothetical protein